MVMVRSCSTPHSRLERRLAQPVRKFDRLLWPIMIIVGLLIVVIMNAVFIYVAVSDRDEVVPSYHTESR